ncbi:MAG: transporter related [Paenibacillus sp.]|nr:transporter related [Paenibacillus sp.]
MHISNITKSYGGGRRLWRNDKRFYAVRNVSFSLREGECLGIVGESGSGKSTLGKLILGLEKPDSGQCKFQGTDIHRASNKQVYTLQRDLQAVFQDSYSALNPRMTAGQIISEPLRNFERLSVSEMNRKQAELLDSVGLCAEDAAKYPHQFSGGQQQRLNIARAIALRPKLIVLDEAVSSLDMMIQGQIMEMLLDMKRRFGLSYLFISHDIKAACYISDRLMVMEGGAIAEKLENTARLDEFRHPASLRLLESQLPEHPDERVYAD